MARIGVTFDDIAQAADLIETQGEKPTVDRVREVLGTGSKSTIAPLLKRWHDAICAKGVNGYSFDDAVRDYRYFTFSGFSVAFAAPMIVERTERGDKMFMTMIRRHVDQIMANDALSLL